MLDAVQMMKFGGALLLVLALMLGLSLLMRRINAGSGIGLNAGNRRLKIVEILPLSPRQRLILIKRDDREHLVILGPTGETVVESGIIPKTDPKTETQTEKPA